MIVRLRLKCISEAEEGEGVCGAARREKEQRE